MCSVNEEEDVNNLMKANEVITEIGCKCKKCDANESEVVLRGKDPYCRACFLVNATHKFRASLGKSKMVRKGDKVLIAFSGSASSMCLLHLVDAGFNKETHKRLVFDPVVIYIDEGSVHNSTVEKRKQILNDVVSKLTLFQLPSFVSSLDLLFQTDKHKVLYDLNSDLPISSESRVINLFKNVTSETSRIDLLAKLRNNLLLKIAESTGCCKVITAETLVSTATKLLSNISLGRGFQLPFDVGFCDSRNKDVHILRPLQDFENEEVCFYNKVHGLDCVDSASLTYNCTKNSSIQMLTRKFVNDLQDNFSSTVSTVYRTGAKLNTDVSQVQSETCSLCKAPKDTEYLASSSLQATIYSSVLSKRGPSYNSNEQSNIVDNSGIMEEDHVKGHCNGGGCGDKCSKQSKAIGREDVTQALCYGCRLIANDLSDPVDMLPEGVRNSIEHSSIMRRMKNEIKDFLL